MYTLTTMCRSRSLKHSGRTPDEPLCWHSSRPPPPTDRSARQVLNSSRGYVRSWPCVQGHARFCPHDRRSIGRIGHPAPECPCGRTRRMECREPRTIGRQWERSHHSSHDPRTRRTPRMREKYVRPSAWNPLFDRCPSVVMCPSNCINMSVQPLSICIFFIRVRFGRFREILQSSMFLLHLVQVPRTDCRVHT